MFCKKFEYLNMVCLFDFGFTVDGVMYLIYELLKGVALVSC